MWRNIRDILLTIENNFNFCLAIVAASFGIWINVLGNPKFKKNTRVNQLTKSKNHQCYYNQKTQTSDFACIIYHYNLYKLHFASTKGQNLQYLAKLFYAPRSDTMLYKSDKGLNVTVVLRVLEKAATYTIKSQKSVGNVRLCR